MNKLPMPGAGMAQTSEPTKSEEPETVDLFEVLNDITLKLHTVSQYCGALLDKINDLYIRLDIASKVIDKVATTPRNVTCLIEGQDPIIGFARGIPEDDYKKLVQDCVAEVKEIVDRTGFLAKAEAPQA